MYDGFISYSHAADDLLAPRLQAGLQKFAKPWWKRRAVRIFRDESSLAANPHLWSSITEALESSGWFVLLLSPDAAASEWVGKEIEHWKATKPVDRILPVVTDGEFGWSDDDVAGSSVPEALHGVFTEEPRWVDLRFARSEEHLDLQNPTFSAAIADIASAIRGVPKDELESEEVRQHRRTVRTAWAAGIALLALSVVAVGASIQSGRNANEAQRQSVIAAEQAEIAEASAEAEAAARADADANAAEADAQRIAAVRAGSLAEVRELAAAAIAMLEVDPELAVLLGLEAIRSAPDTDDPPLETKIALRQAIQSSRLIARHEIEVDGEIFFADLSPAADAVVTAEETSVRLVDLQTGTTVWTRSLSDLEGRDGSPGSICPGEVFFSLTGTEIFVGLIDGSGTGCNADVPEAHTPGSGVVVLDASTGDVLRSRWLGSCPDQVIGSPSPDGSLLPVVTPADGNCDPGTPLDWTITLLDTADLEPIREIPIPDFGMTSWSADGSRISIGSFFGLGAVVYDALTGDEVSVMDDEFFLGFLSPDGSMLAGTDIETAVIVYDVETGRAIDRLPDLGDGPRHITWTDDGSGLMAGGQGSRSAVWHVETGEVDILLPNTGSAVTIHSDDEAGRLVHVGADNVTVWDVSGGLAGVANAANTETVGGLIQANSLTGGPTSGAFLVRSDTFDWFVRPFDTSTGELGTTSLLVEMGRRTAVLDDGRVVVFATDRSSGEPVIGPVGAWDPSSGDLQPLWGCAARVSDLGDFDPYVASTGSCVDGAETYFDYDRALMSGDRSTLVVSSRAGDLLIFDPSTLELVEVSVLPESAVSVKDVGATWLATSNLPKYVGSPTEEITLFSLPAMEAIVTVPGRIVESDRTGAFLAVEDGPGHVTVLDTSNGEVVTEFEGGTGRVRGLAFSPDGSLFMTSATDGFVRIWKVSSGTEIERIPLGGDSGDGYWIDDDTIAIGTFEGVWTNLDIGLDSLLDLARSSLLRSFTEQECLTYRIDPCPTLDEMRSR